MRVELKWIEGVRKRPVPAKYACNLALDNPPTEVWSCIIDFKHNVRTLGDLHLYRCEYLDVPDHFFLTEGGCVVAEAQGYVG